ncbi:MAG: ROK family protein [Bacteroidales bacterium]
MNQEPFFPLLGNIAPGQLKGIKKKRFLQQTRILRNLYVHGSASNAEIGKRLKISLPTSLTMLNELLDRGLVDKKGYGKSKGGRKPVMYGLKNNSVFSLGIHVERFRTHMAIYNNENQNISGTVSYSSDITDPGGFVEELFRKASDLVEETMINTEKLICVGIIMPGLVDSVRGVNHTHLNFDNQTTREVLEEKFNRPVFIENDAKAMAHAELRFGKAKGKQNVLMIFLEWGLGLGIIVDGKIYRGALGFAGELSHIPAIDNDIHCQCGKQGCLETIASGAAISRMAIEGIDSGKISVLRNQKENGTRNISTKDVVEAANSGDLYAISILSDVGINLGKGLASLMQLFNPELVILSGNVCEAKQYITTPVQQALNTYCMPQIREHTGVEISGLGKNHGILGAVSMAMEYVFDHPFLVKGYSRHKKTIEKTVIKKSVISKS